MSKELLTDALELDVAERIQLAQDIWDSITRVPESLELTADQKAELARRIESFRKDPSDSISWEELKAEIGL